MQSQLSITVSADLKEFYEKNKGAAEEMLLSNVPWLTAYIGDVFKIPSNGKLKRNLYILGEENNKEPTVQPLSAKKPELKNLAEGTKVRIQCEKRAESHHYEIYKIVPHDSSRESEPPFHEVAEQMAVVAHINQAKQLAYVTVRRGVDLTVPLSSIPNTIKTGSILALRLVKSIRRERIIYRAITARTALNNEHEQCEALSRFKGKCHIAVPGFGWVHLNDGKRIFIEPRVVEQYSLTTGSSIEGTAIQSYNKKRSEWNLKVFSLNTC